MSFSERVSQAEEQIQEEARKKRAAELAAKAEAAVKEQDRIEAIKNDPRYKRLVELAHSPELMEALDYIADVYGRANSYEHISPVSFTEDLTPSSNRPVGTITVERELGEVHFAIAFTWLDRETTGAYSYITRWGVSMTPVLKSNVKMLPGLTIVPLYSHEVCYTIDELLANLAKDVASGKIPGNDPVDYTW